MHPALPIVLTLGQTLIERFFPDPQKKAEAELELLKMTGEQEFQKIVGQLKINKEEAKHQSVFVAGWRPAIGWGCGAGLLYHSFLYNLVDWASKMFGIIPPAPPDPEVLMYVLGGILGLGGYRTYEKVKNVPGAK